MSANQNSTTSALNVKNVQMSYYCDVNHSEDHLIKYFFDEDIMLNFIYSNYDNMDTWTGRYYIKKTYDRVYLIERKNKDELFLRASIIESYRKEQQDHQIIMFINEIDDDLKKIYRDEQSDYVYIETNYTNDYMDFEEFEIKKDDDDDVNDNYIKPIKKRLIEDKRKKVIRLINEKQKMFKLHLCDGDYENKIYCSNHLEGCHAILDQLELTHDTLYVTSRNDDYDTDEIINKIVIAFCDKEDFNIVHIEKEPESDDEPEFDPFENFDNRCEETENIIMEVDNLQYYFNNLDYISNEKTLLYRGRPIGNVGDYEIRVNRWAFRYSVKFTEIKRRLKQLCDICRIDFTLD
jgi:hypothetical protein